MFDFVVSDIETAYPDGAVHTDGYWYELFDLKSFGIDYGEVTLASAVASVTVSHKLGVVPSLAAFIFNNSDVSTSMNETFMNVNGHVLFTSLAAGKFSCFDANIELTETNISFSSRSSNVPFAATTYYWIAIA